MEEKAKDETENVAKDSAATANEISRKADQNSKTSGLKKDFVKNLVTLGLVGTLMLLAIYTTVTGNRDELIMNLFATATTATITFYLGFQMGSSKSNQKGE